MAKLRIKLEDGGRQSANGYHGPEIKDHGEAVAESLATAKTPSVPYVLTGPPRIWPRLSCSPLTANHWTHSLRMNPFLSSQADRSSPALSFYPCINPLVTFLRTLHKNVLILASLTNKYL
jgi:hypothetical protein